MKRRVLGFVIGVCILGITGCMAEKQEKEKALKESRQADLTIMHIDAENPEFQKFIRRAEKELQMEIEVLSCPENADNRHAKISTILAAGEASVDIFTVNDEMVSEFKHKQYLELLNETVMSEEVFTAYPQSYMEHIAMQDGKIYSVPYFMDIMVFWVNRSVIGTEEIRTEEDFRQLLKKDFGEECWGYGSAWDSAYVYNELSEMIQLFGGSYYDWDNPQTKAALTFLHEMAESNRHSLAWTADQYEQMEQKFLEGKYGSIFMYSGAMDTFQRAGAYGKEQIQVVPLPQFTRQATNIAAWQYVLNRSSKRKDNAVKFLQYAASREGSIAYSECMSRLPARIDIICEEELDIPGFEVLRDYVENVELKERSLSANTMGDITAMGNLFQKYITDEISQEDFCKKSQQITDSFF